MADQHFGQFTLDSNSVLSRDGDKIHVPPKELQLLKILLRHRGRVVSLETIEQEIWPRQQVSYASIARCVYELRKILGDQDRAIVVSVPKRGYRFGLAVSGRPAQVVGSTALKVAHGSTRAYSDFIEAGRQANTGTFRGLQRAVELFEKASEADPEFAVAHAAIADCALFQGMRGYVHPAEAFDMGLARTAQALELDAELASAHAVRGWFYCVADDLAKGFESLEFALSLDPEYARGVMYLSFAQRLAGMREESLETAYRAVELDPYAILHRRGLAWRMFCCGMPEEALEIERGMTRDYPEDAEAHGAFGIYAAFLGLHDEAVKATERAIHLADNSPGVMTLHTYALACAGRHDEARALANDLHNKELPRAPRSHLAMTYVPLGDYDRALELLREARDEKCPWFRNARFDPRLEALRTDSRLLALFEGLP